MRAVVTGAAGFTGTHLIEHLLRQGDRVLAITQSASEHQRVIDRWQDRVICRTWDIRADAPQALLRDVANFSGQVVYHLAAISYPSQCGDREPNDTCRAVNIEGARRVAELCVATSISRMLLVSTAHVYGGLRPAPWIAKETDPADPQSGYAKSKWEAERLVARVLDGHATELTVARVFNHTGPNQRGPLLVPEWAAQFADPHCETVRVRSLHTCIDLSDVRDIVRAYRLLMTLDQPLSLVNVGSGKVTCTGDLFDLFADVCGRRPAVRELSSDPKGGPIADGTQLRAATQWEPRIPLRKTIADTMAAVFACARIQRQGE